MADTSTMPTDPGAPRPPSKPPLQFGLRAVLLTTVVVALLFGALRWLEVPPLASAIILVILVVSVAAALGLVVAIAAGSEDEK